MLAYLNQIDWKVVLLTLVACYIVPGLVVGTLFAFVLQDAIPAALGQAMASFIAFVALLIPPVAGGYVAARLAPRMPYVQVITVGVFGALLSLVVLRSSVRGMLVYAVASVALAVLGGFIRLRMTKTTTPR